MPLKQRSEYKLNDYRRLLKKTPGLLEISERACTKALSAADPDLPQAQICVSMFVLGPTLLAFVSWVLKQAQETGKRRLYFLARDGWLMYRMAQTLCEVQSLSAKTFSGKTGSEKQYSLECRYLYASRYAWRLPEQHLIGTGSLERICRGGMHVTFSDLMRRAGLTEREAKKIARLVQPGRGVDETLSWREIRRLRAPLAECSEFCELADRRSRSRYEAAIGYLTQEGLLEDIPYALVDSGWIGTMQESLGHLLQSAGYSRPLEGYYFGLYSLPETADRKGYHGWYFEPASGTGRKTLFSNCLFECIFTAPHGMTEGYERKGKRWEPILTPAYPEKEKWVRQQMMLLTLYLETVADFCSEDAESHPGSLSLEAEQVRIPALLKSFMSAPSREESACYGNALFSDDVTEEKMRPLAECLTQRQFMDHHLVPRLRLMLFPGGRKLHDSGWMEGSIRLYGGRLYAWHRMGMLLYRYVLYTRMRHDFRKRRKAA